MIGKRQIRSLPGPTPTPPYFSTLGAMLCVTWLNVSSATAAPLPSACFSNVGDYTYSWWAYGLRDPRQVFCIQTSRYGLAFDFDQLALTSFGPLSNPVAEADALVSDNSVVLSLPASSLGCVIESNGVRYSATGAGPSTYLCELIESGKFFQRRRLQSIQWASGAPSVTSLLEVASWPDRVSFLLRVTPTTTITNGAIEISLQVGSAYSSASAYGEGAALSSAAGQGFVFLRDSPSALFSVTGASQRCTVRLPVTNWAAGVEKVVGVIVYPFATDMQGSLVRAVNGESSPLQVSASGQLQIYYDRRYGWHYVPLNETDTSWPNNDRIERVTVVVANPTSSPRVVRFNFGKEGNVYSITGVSAILRDSDAYPTGIPIQLSKDWHNWVWWHALTMLTVPANTSITFEYTSVNAHWGGVAAASHSQLCLVGYGGNQLWDQAALGSWGESITYDPDVNLGRAMIDDVRPTMVWATGYDTPTKWTWTNNVGGGDFLVYYDQAGNKQWNGRMRTQYRRYCPVLTEVSYAGQTQDGKIDLKCTASMYRSDDINRAVYHLRYDVRQPVTFSRLAFYQLGADNYNDHNFSAMARGNESGLIEEFSPCPCGAISYNRIGIPCPGSVPWFSLHRGNTRDFSTGAWANRGLVIRSWEARVNGQNVPPYASVFSTYNNGWPSANVELSPPPGVNTLMVGDYVDAEIVQVIMPQYADDYYGPNAALAAALTTGQDTWRMIRREATGNDLGVQVIEGTLEQRYPVRIRAARGSCAHFTVTGGLGYVPITVTGLSSYRNTVLQRASGANWTAIDQTVHGKDYWQSDYDPHRGQWELTYTIPLDTPGDVRQTMEFQMDPTQCRPLTARADFDWDGDVDQTDFAHLQICLTPPFPSTLAPGCEDADFNTDQRVGSEDLNTFMNCMGLGADVPVDPACAG